MIRLFERNKVHIGDALDVLRGFPDRSVHMIVTSPPYWGLRDYGTGEWVGGDPECDHKKGGRSQAQLEGSTLVGSKRNVGNQLEGFKSVCPRCGAERVDRQIGLEESPDQYVERLVGVFREARRVLRDDGTLWLNLGDSYASSGQSGKIGSQSCLNNGKGINPKHSNLSFGRDPTPDGLKTKDLVGIPWMVAFALRADGWYLRSDIIWHKPNPMPESVQDRPTKAHEYIFLLSKSKRYFYDAEAIKDPIKDVSLARLDRGNSAQHKNVNGAPGQSPHSIMQPRANKRFGSAPGRNDARKQYRPQSSGANKRSVWSITTKPYSESHYAVFPPDLIEPCIKAGTSEYGVCAECGTPWERVIDKESQSIPVKDRNGRVGHNGGPPQQSGWFWQAPKIRGEYWQPGCQCNAETTPAVVLDPFMGSGTTAMVCEALDRDWVGIDLDESNLMLVDDRLKADWQKEAEARIEVGQLALFDFIGGSDG